MTTSVTHACMRHERDFSTTLHEIQTRKMPTASNLAALVGGAAAVALAVRALHARLARPVQRRVIVASTAQQKLDAAANALNATVHGENVASLVSDQPIGLDETMRGAKNRMGQLLDTDAVNDADLAVAMENGLVKCLDGDFETWLDIAVVIVRDLKNEKESVASSVGVQFPTTAIADWAEAGAEGTVGEILADELKCDKQDPHVALTKGAFKRAALLEQAIRVAAASL